MFDQLEIACERQLEHEKQPLAENEPAYMRYHSRASLYVAPCRTIMVAAIGSTAEILTQSHPFPSFAFLNADQWSPEARTNPYPERCPNKSFDRACSLACARLKNQNKSGWPLFPPSTQLPFYQPWLDHLLGGQFTPPGRISPFLFPQHLDPFETKEKHFTATMFYNSDVLSQRKGGLGVIWWAATFPDPDRSSLCEARTDLGCPYFHRLGRLAATIGNKSNFRKLSKREIVSIDVSKAW